MQQPPSPRQPLLALRHAWLGRRRLVPPSPQLKLDVAQTQWWLSAARSRSWGAQTTGAACPTPASHRAHQSHASSPSPQVGGFDKRCWHRPCVCFSPLNPTLNCPPMTCAGIWLSVRPHLSLMPLLSCTPNSCSATPQPKLNPNNGPAATHPCFCCGLFLSAVKQLDRLIWPD